MAREAVLPGNHRPAPNAKRCEHCGSTSFYEDADAMRCLACSSIVGPRQSKPAPSEREPYAQLLIIMPAVLKATKAREEHAPTLRERRRLREQRVRVQAAISVLTQEQNIDSPHCPKCDAEVKTPGRQCHSCASKGPRKIYRGRVAGKNRYFDRCIGCGTSKFPSTSPRCLSCGQKARRARERQGSE